MLLLEIRPVRTQLSSAVRFVTKIRKYLPRWENIYQNSQSCRAQAKRLPGRIIRSSGEKLWGVSQIGFSCRITGVWTTSEYSIWPCIPYPRAVQTPITIILQLNPRSEEKLCIGPLLILNTAICFLLFLFCIVFCIFYLSEEIAIVDTVKVLALPDSARNWKKKDMWVAGIELASPRPQRGILTTILYSLLSHWFVGTPLIYYLNPIWLTLCRTGYSPAKPDPWWPQTLWQLASKPDPYFNTVQARHKNIRFKNKHAIRIWTSRV